MINVFIVCHKGKRKYIVDKVYRREQAALSHCRKLQRYNPFNNYEVRKVSIEL